MSRAPIHVVHIVHGFRTGGLENGIVNLVNHLPPEQFRHSIVCLAGFDPAFAGRLRQPVHIESIDKAPGADWKFFLPMWRVLRRLRPDVVHTRNIATLEYQIPAFLAGIKHRVHGEHGWDINDMAGSNRRYIKIRQLLKYLVHDFIALSAQSKEYLLDRVGICPRRCYQIINGVDTDTFCPQGPRAEAPAGFLDQAHTVFGSVGRLATVKNHRMLAEAFIRLCRAQPERAAGLRLIIVGDGEHEGELRQLFAEAGLSAQVWMAGNRDDIPALMRLFDLFVLPSLAEGISNTVLEALASGLPVIATDVGGNPELIRDGHTGRLTPCTIEGIRQAMASYSDEPALIAQQGHNAREDALRRYGILTMVQNYGRLYQAMPA